MPLYKPLKPEKSNKYTFVCRCGEKLDLQIKGDYESVRIECVKCMNEITLSKEEVEKCAQS